MNVHIQLVYFMRCFSKIQKSKKYLSCLLREKCPKSVRTRKNKNQKNSEYGYFSRSSTYFFLRFSSIVYPVNIVF